MENLKTSYDPLNNCTTFDCTFMNKVISTNETLYWNKEHGIQYMENRNSRNGFGGHKFKFNLDDGTSKIVKGPWSSRPSVVRKYVDHTFVGFEEHLIANQFILWVCKRNCLAYVYDIKTQRKTTYYRYHDITNKQLDAGHTIEDWDNSTWWPKDNYQPPCSLDINKINMEGL